MLENIRNNHKGITTKKGKDMKRPRVTAEYREAAIRLGKKIRNLREQNELTQIAFGKIIGVPQTTISSWESGGTIPDCFELFRVAELFETDIRDFKPEIKLNYEEHKQQEETDIKRKIEALERVVYQIAEKVGVEN